MKLRISSIFSYIENMRIIPRDSFSAASEEALTRVWENDEDAVYDAF